MLKMIEKKEDTSPNATVQSSQDKLKDAHRGRNNATNGGHWRQVTALHSETTPWLKTSQRVKSKAKTNVGNGGNRNQPLLRTAAGSRNEDWSYQRKRSFGKMSGSTFWSSRSVVPFPISRFSDGLVLNLADKVRSKVALTRCNTRRVRLVCPFSIPGACIVVDPEDEGKPNFFRFDDETHPNAPAGKIIFSQEGGICDMWASYLHMMLDTICCPEAVLPSLGKVFNAMKHELDAVCGDPIVIKCKGIMSIKAGRNSPSKCVYGTDFEAATPTDRERLRKLRRWVTRFETTLRALEEEVQIDRHVFTGMGCNRSEWRKIVIRKFSAPVKDFEEKDFAELCVPQALISEIRLLCAGDETDEFENDPRFTAFPVRCRKILTDIDGEECRKVLSTSDPPQLVMYRESSDKKFENAKQIDDDAAPLARCCAVDDSDGRLQNKSPQEPSATHKTRKSGKEENGKAENGKAENGKACESAAVALKGVGEIGEAVVATVRLGKDSGAMMHRWSRVHKDAVIVVQTAGSFTQPSSNSKSLEDEQTTNLGTIGRNVSPPTPRNNFLRLLANSTTGEVIALRPASNVGSVQEALKLIIPNEE